MAEATRWRACLEGAADPAGGPRLVEVPVEEGRTIQGDLVLAERPRGLVLFAHGSGSGRTSPRNRAVAGELERVRLGTLLLDLLTPAEAQEDEASRRFRFEIPLLASRLVAAIDWCDGREGIADLPLGLYGASTGGAAVLLAASERPDRVRAVVLRGARTDLAELAFPAVRAPTLALVGEHDPAIVAMNREAVAHLPPSSRLTIVPGATHLFGEPGALREVARKSTEWFLTHLHPRD